LYVNKSFPFLRIRYIAEVSEHILSRISFGIESKNKEVSDFFNCVPFAVCIISEVLLFIFIDCASTKKRAKRSECEVEIRVVNSACSVRFVVLIEFEKELNLQLDNWMTANKN